jgi:hypothetical protein
VTVGRLEALLLALALALGSAVVVPMTPGVAMAAGGIYYVSTSGSDTAAGTSTAPWRTIQKAANTAKAGDTVYIRPGTYDERVVISSSGTSGAPILFTAESSRPKISRGIDITGDYIEFSQFTPWPLQSSMGSAVSAVQVSGNNNHVHGFDIPTGSLGASGVGFEGTASYNVVSDFAITDIQWCGGSTAPQSHHNILKDGYVHGFGGGVCIGNLDGSYNTIENVEITSVGISRVGGGWQVTSGDGDGILPKGDHNTIRGCKIHHLWPASSLAEPHTDAIQWWTGTTNLLIENCVLGSFATAPAGTRLPGCYDPPNAVFMIAGMSAGQSAVIRNNVILGGEGIGPGYFLMYNGDGGNKHDLSFYNNTLVTTHNMMTDPNLVGPVRNNIFYGDGNGQPGGLTFEHNLYPSAGLDYGEADKFVGAPMFVNGDTSAATNYGVNADWRLQSASAAIDKGVLDAGTPLTDAAGNVRVGAPDIGAFEYTGGGISPPADTTAPAVSVTAPISGATVSGSVALSATATDSGSGMSKVEFRVDGVLVGTDTSSPYTGTWNSAGATVGSHVIEAKAFDVAGNSAVNSVSVTIAAPPVVRQPVYRFYNPSRGAYFYTASEAEKRKIITKMRRKYRYQGIAFYATSVVSGSVPVYRFYNPRRGAYLYTASEAEKRKIITKMRKTYRYQGIAFFATSEVSGSVPVYRFYNPRRGAYFYTVSEAEKRKIITKMRWKYRYQGAAFRSM